MEQALMNSLAYLIYVMYFLVALVILKNIFSSRLKQHHSNWNTLIDNFSFSTQDYYKLLREELNSHGITGMKITLERLKEGNIFSAKRLYLRVEWKDYQYDMCAAPFGDNGFFLSSWLLQKHSIGEIILYKIPFIGGWLVGKFYPMTYYKHDTASMFMSYCHQSVLTVLDSITKESGIRLSDTERKPILNDVFKRK